MECPIIQLLAREEYNFLFTNEKFILFYGLSRVLSMQQPSPQQNIPPGMQTTMIPPQGQQQMEKMDNISKVKSLLPALRESLKNVFSSAAYLLNQNNFICNG